MTTSYTLKEYEAWAFRDDTDKYAAQRRAQFGTYSAHSRLEHLRLRSRGTTYSLSHLINEGLSFRVLRRYLGTHGKRDHFP